MSNSEIQARAVAFRTLFQQIVCNSSLSDAFDEVIKSSEYVLPHTNCGPETMQDNRNSWS